MLYSPIAGIFFVIFFLFTTFFLLLIQINVITLAFIKIGISPQLVMITLFFILVGSFINIPIMRIPQETMVTQKRINFFGFVYIIPVWKKKVTILAINVGGAVIPSLVSFYLLFKSGLYFKGILATLFIAIICYKLAKPIRGIGIALPFFIPPSLAAIFSILIAYDSAPIIAYISGTLGTLIGADIFNLKKISQLGAPVASIGGAGTFDGIFLTGILAVLFSSIFS
ncbi:MAG: DUF1614 domain-containing protein [Thermodesulfobacteriota bacterium]